MQQYPDEKYCIMFLYMDDQQKLDKRHLLGKTTLGTVSWHCSFSTSKNVLAK